MIDDNFDDRRIDVGLKKLDLRFASPAGRPLQPDIDALTGWNFPVWVSVICNPLPSAFGMLPRPFHKNRHEVFERRAYLAGQIVAVFIGNRIVHVGGLAQLQLHDMDIIFGPAVLPGDVTAFEPLVERRGVAVGRRQDVHEPAGKMRAGAGAVGGTKIEVAELSIKQAGNGRFYRVGIE